jgi:hypothetical protein
MLFFPLLLSRPVIKLSDLNWPNIQSPKALFMSIFKRKSLGPLVPIHEDNAKTNDWVVLLEAATIVGQERDKLRVALTTQERKLVRKKRLFQKPKYFLVVKGYDPRIHGLYFCPQLYRKEHGDLVPLSGQEIGQLMAQALEGRRRRESAVV